LTPARPPEDPDTLQLAEWLPQEYDYVIDLAEGYPSTLPEDLRGPQNRDYYAAYRYASILQGEALLEYPTAFEATNWNWEQAYNFARIGDQRAAVRYASLIEEIYNTEGVIIGNLEGWIRQNDPRLWLETFEIPTIDEHSDYSLLKLNSEGGSAYLWLVEIDQETTIYPLSSEFNFPDRNLPDQFWSDITGDGIDELVIHHPDTSTREILFPRVFDLSVTPPKELQFKPNQGFEIGLENEYQPVDRTQPCRLWYSTCSWNYQLLRISNRSSRRCMGTRNCYPIDGNFTPNLATRRSIRASHLSCRCKR
jgi:hypothetical protein